MDFSNQKFRASQMGKIMSGVKFGLSGPQQKTYDKIHKRVVEKGIEDLPKGLRATYGDLLNKLNSKPSLSSGAKTYLNELYHEKVFNRSREISTKYMEKGNIMELDAMDLYSEVSSEFVSQHEGNLSNDYFTGTPDILTDDMVIDIKCSWAYHSFPLHGDIEPKLYYYQLMTYMELTGLRKSKLAYCLVDTPLDLVEDELRRACWKCGAVSMDSMPKELKVEIVSNMIYSRAGLEAFCQQSIDIELDWFEGVFTEIAPSERVTLKEIEYNPIDIENMKYMVGQARDFLNNITIELASKKQAA